MNKLNKNNLKDIYNKDDIEISYELLSKTKYKLMINNKMNYIIVNIILYYI